MEAQKIDLHAGETAVIADVDGTLRRQGFVVTHVSVEIARKLGIVTGGFLGRMVARRRFLSSKDAVEHWHEELASYYRDNHWTRADVADLYDDVYRNFEPSALAFPGTREVLEDIHDANVYFTPLSSSHDMELLAWLRRIDAPTDNVVMQSTHYDHDNGGFIGTANVRYSEKQKRDAVQAHVHDEAVIAACLFDSEREIGVFERAHGELCMSVAVDGRDTYPKKIPERALQKTRAKTDREWNKLLDTLRDTYRACLCEDEDTYADADPKRRVLVTPNRSLEILRDAGFKEHLLSVKEEAL